MKKIIKDILEKIFNYQNPEHKYFPIYICINTSFLLVGAFFIFLAKFQSDSHLFSTFIVNFRLYFGVFLISIWFSFFPIHNSTKINLSYYMLSCCLALTILIGEFIYFVLVPFQFFFLDIIAGIAGICMFTVFLYVLFMFSKNIFSFVHYFVAKYLISSSDSTLKRVLETCASILIALSSLITAISGISLALKTIFNI